MKLKARISGAGSYQKHNTVWGSPSYEHGFTVSYGSGAQYVHTEGHPYWLAGKGADVGGPFVSQRIESTFGPAEPIWLDDGGRFTIYTRAYPSHSAQALANGWGGLSSPTAIQAKVAADSPALVSGFDLDGYGATAISRTAPTNPVVDGAATIAELISERKFFAIPGRNGSVSGEYLNYQLGIAPALGAISDFRKAAESSEKLLKQLHRDSGRSVRRRYEFPSEPAQVAESTSHGVYPVGDVAISTYLCGTGTRTVRSWTTRKIWFSGSFTYFLPEDVGLSRSVAELDYLYGIKPGVDTAWELLPFSFVADYFGNLGDVVKNLNSFSQDALVLNYGYIMAETIHEVHDTWVGPLRYGDYDWRTTELACKTKYVNKQRRPATPYGFGVLLEDLTPKQMSILAALGMNRR